MVNVSLFCIKKYSFTLNYTLLQDIYQPVVGSTAISIYMALYNEVQKQAMSLSIATEMNEFLKVLNVSYVEFCSNRAKLEAIGLLSSYLQNQENKSIYTFMVNEPLDFVSFISNPKKRQLLLTAIGQLNYDKLEFFYSSNRIPVDAVNVSATFESVFNNESLNNVSLIDFNVLYKNLCSNSSANIVIKDTSKNIIESYFASYDITIKEIEHIIYNSIILTDDGVYIVDDDLLKLNFNKFTQQVQNVNLLNNVKFNRNIKMFTSHLSSNELNETFNQYGIFNSEQFLRMIIKQPLSDEQKQTISKLKDKYSLPDTVINLLIDFTIFKTKGFLNDTYVCKVANTINVLGLSSLQQIYDYFHFKNNIVKKTNNYSSNELVEWEGN